MTIRHRASMLVALCLVGSANSAEISLNTSSEYCSAQAIHVRGSILKGDSKIFESAVEGWKKHIKRVFGDCLDNGTVVLDSGGGDVEEALAMGALIRSARLRTKVRQTYGGYNGKCFSSCVFILAGGIVREESRGEVGIHRPYVYDIEKGSSVEEIQNARLSQINKIRTYLEKMDVATTLLDAMIAIPPDQIKILTKDDLNAYRLIGEDPSYEEYRVNRNARLFNLTSSEYRKLHAVAWDKCFKADWRQPNVCVASELLGISLKEVQTRWDRYEGCSNKTKNEIAQDECFRKYITRGETH